MFCCEQITKLLTIKVPSALIINNYIRYHFPHRPLSILYDIIICIADTNVIQTGGHTC